MGAPHSPSRSSSSYLDAEEELPTSTGSLAPSASLLLDDEHGSSAHAPWPEPSSGGTSASEAARERVCVTLDSLPERLLFRVLDELDVRSLLRFSLTAPAYAAAATRYLGRLEAVSARGCTLPRAAALGLFARTNPACVREIDFASFRGLNGAPRVLSATDVCAQLRRAGEALRAVSLSAARDEELLTLTTACHGVRRVALTRSALGVSHALLLLEMLPRLERLSVPDAPLLIEGFVEQMPKMLSGARAFPNVRVLSLRVSARHRDFPAFLACFPRLDALELCMVAPRGQTRSLLAIEHPALRSLQLRAPSVVQAPLIRCPCLEELLTDSGVFVDPVHFTAITRKLRALRRMRLSFSEQVTSESVDLRPCFAVRELDFSICRTAAPSAPGVSLAFEGAPGFASPVRTSPPQQAHGRPPPTPSTLEEYRELTVFDNLRRASQILSATSPRVFLSVSILPLLAHCFPALRRATLTGIVGTVDDGVLSCFFACCPQLASLRLARLTSTQVVKQHTLESPTSELSDPFSGLPSSPRPSDPSRPQLEPLEIHMCHTACGCAEALAGTAVPVRPLPDRLQQLHLNGAAISDNLCAWLFALGVAESLVDLRFLNCPNVSTSGIGALIANRDVSNFLPHAAPGREGAGSAAFRSSVWGDSLEPPEEVFELPDVRCLQDPLAPGESRLHTVRVAGCPRVRAAVLVALILCPSLYLADVSLALGAPLTRPQALALVKAHRASLRRLRLFPDLNGVAAFLADVAPGVACSELLHN